MMDYWLSTKSNVNLNPRRYETPELEAFLRANVGIDPAILAADLPISVSQVIAYQRRLGLRPCMPSNPDYA